MKTTRSKFGKRIIALLLTVIMAVCLTPAMVYGDPDAPITADDFEVLGAGEFTYESGVEHSISINIKNEELSDADITYEYDGNTSSEAFSFENAGTYYVGYTISKAGYETYFDSAKLTINKADRTSFAFSKTGEVIEYVAGTTTYTQTVTYIESEEPKDITYSISSGSASVNNSGVVTFTDAGNVTVKAVMAESDNYSESTAEYSVRAKVKGSHAFTIPDSATTKYGSDFTNAVSLEEGDTVVYSSSDESIATVDGNGKVEILKVGSVTITATITDVDGLIDTTSYTLTINKGTQTIAFEQASPADLAYDDSLDNKASGGAGTGEITYSIVSGGDYASLSGSTLTATKAGGTVTVKAVKAEDAHYESAEATYTVKTIQAEQTDFDFAESIKSKLNSDNKYPVDYGTKHMNIEVVGAKTTPITYVSSDTSLATVNDQGRVSFANKKTGEVTITVTAPEDPDKYFAKSIELIIVVSERTHSNIYTLTGTKGKNEWYISDVTIKAADGFEISTDNSFEDENIWKTEYQYSDGVYSGENAVKLYGKNIEKGWITKQVTVPDFKVDTVSPANFTITCNTDFVKTVLETITFGFFKSDIVIQLEAEDATSGIDYYEYAIKSGDSYGTPIKSNNGQFTITSEFKGTIKVTAYDKAGNSITKYVTIKDGEVESESLLDLNDKELAATIVLDKTEPAVTITPPDATASSGSTRYYNEEAGKKINVKVEDYLNIEAADTGLTFKRNGADESVKFKSFAVSGTDYPYTYTYDIVMADGDIITDISVTAEDYATNATTEANTDTHIYDISKPDIVITAPSTVADEYQKAVDGTYYYNKEQKLVVEVSDKNLNTAETILTYKLNGSDVTVKFDSEDIVATPESSSVNATIKYAYTYEFEDGDKIEAISVTAKDLATNSSDGSDSNAYVYDATAPQATLIPVKTESGAYDNKVGTSYYYKNEQTFTIEVVDKYFNEADSTISYKENGTAVTIDFSNLEKVKKEELPVEGKNPDYKYTFEYTIKPGTMVSNLVVDTVDLATNPGNEVKDDNTYVIDNTVPVVSIKADGNISGWYTRGSDLYVIFNKTATGDSGQGSTNTASETLTITATVTDKNIAATKTAGGEMSFYVADVAGGYAIESDITQNIDSSIVMTKSLTVTPDKSGIMSFSIDVVDLAGNRPADFATEGILGNVKDSITKNGKGGFSATFISDRNRPSSTNKDDINPVIILTPNGDDRGEIVNARGYKERLYAGSMSYAVTVYDPVYNNKYSGLKDVSWEIDSATKKITTNGSSTNTGAQSQNFTIQVNAPAETEDNDIVLTVTALDNANNKTTYVQYLAIDNWAPRVTVTCDNNDAQNGKYFKTDRTITVAIEDLNFTLDRTSFTTQVNPGWSASGIVHTATFTYATDGDYSIAGATRDLANNGGDIDFAPVTAYADFTIDKTAPVISITNVNAGEYYNADRTANITITEHNFNAAEVQTDVTASLNGDGIAAPGVSDFASAGDTRSASIDFNVEGDFTITVNYTDLAGNPAETQSVGKFTVDKTKPMINISGVEDKAAYTGSVEPVIEISDINFSQDQKDYTVSYSVYKLDKNGTQVLTVPAGTPVSIDGKDAVRISIADLPNTPENDGIYTLVANANDRAGNKADQKSIQFSVNRFGSVYEIVSQNPGNTVNGFTNVRPELVIRETNPDPVISHSISISINGKTIELTEGKDYTVNEVPGGSWHQYEYTIKPDAFEEQGSYIVTINSEDKAGNKNSNRTNVEQNGVDIEFTFDEEAPNGYVTVDGLGVGKTLVNATSTSATVYWEDNIGTAKVVVTVYLDGEVFRTYTVEGEELANLGGNSYLLPEELPEQGGKIYRIEATVTDPAGNEQTFNSGAFKVSTNIFVRLIDNTPLFVGVLVALAAIIGLIIFLIARKKKKGEA